MTNRAYFIGRRKHERFNVKKGAYAVLCSDRNKTGQIEDISSGGLAFKYRVSGKQSSGTCEIEIFKPRDLFHLGKVPVRIVMDFEVNNPVPSSYSPRMQLSLQFGKLTLKQIILLDYFLKHYTEK